MIYITKRKFALLLFIALTITIQSQGIVANACIEFSDKYCIRCARETHLYEGICYKNILGCISYKNGDICTECQYPSFILTNNTCKLATAESHSQMMKSLYKYTGKNGYEIGNQYGQSNFGPIAFETVKSWPTFLTLDKFIRQGQYGFYISRMSNPVYSVNYYIQQEQYSYKILYHGSGGGLFLCIADVPLSMIVNLRSLTPISASSLVDNCFDYDVNGNCLQCKDGQHLQAGKCYPNYGGCIKYFENLCLECQDFYFLIENRCVSDCMSVSDARSILHYGISTKTSTMESFYGISISSFFSVTTTTVTTITTTIIQSGSTTSQPYLPPSLPVNTTASSSIGTSSSSTSSSSVIPPKSNTNMISNNFNSTQYYQILSQLNLSNLATYISSAADGTFLGRSTQTGLSDPNCVARAQNGTCLKCTEDHFVNEQGLCEELSYLCISVSQVDNRCTKCFEGYVLKNGRCYSPSNA